MSKPNPMFQNWLMLLLNILLFFSIAKSQPNCLNSQTYTSNSTYQANLNTIISTLSTNIGNTGFYNASVGQNPDRINAIVLCRGDQSLTTCRECVNSTAHELVQRCSNNMEAIFWNELCLVRYSNNPILNMLQTQPVSAARSSVMVENPRAHDRELRALLKSLRETAARGSNGQKVAAGNRSAPGLQWMYALEQCTPDLSEQDCIGCLTESINYFPSCCGGLIGSGILRPSCTLRFENYRFYNASMVQEVPQEPLPPGEQIISFYLNFMSDIYVTELTQFIFHFVDTNNGRARIFIIIFVPVVILIIVLVVLGVFWRKRKYKNIKKKLGHVESFNEDESLQYDFDTIKTATNNFSDDNKLGEGGFGAVYMGELPNKQSIAVKRLSAHSGQGIVEFKTEVQLLAKLQHRNLVRLLGFCTQNTEKLLVYEFVQKGSLDHYIFDPINSSILDWEKRYKIIAGIAKGLVYLHEDSRLRIIHRDLKASNVLLDEEMNSKIADFGMARLFAQDETQGNTSRVVGTYGYMAPEYAIQGQFSVKTDVFSFGVLVLEIITGQKSNVFIQGKNQEDLLNYVWRNWCEGTVEQVTDPILRATTYSFSEILRCIHIGLLCVQENANNRPTMPSVVLMLNSSSVTMPRPSRPAFYMLSYDQEYSAVTQDKSFSASNTTASVNDVSITEFDGR
ncbi:hypothetical protein RD792_007743 [Penstemon davidsonii]|uniref:Uncharacterized protein n=1 Tax=Penstemon davidsonii TaxID=160366 RepID=A0ABR0D787_9LAMI|nr:hypothetical protein RD792_007743 [Penstemon davidsonii]